MSALRRRWVLPTFLVATLVTNLYRLRYAGRGARYEAFVMLLEGPAECVMALLPWHVIYGGGAPASSNRESASDKSVPPLSPMPPAGTRGVSTPPLPHGAGAPPSPDASTVPSTRDQPNPLIAVNNNDESCGAVTNGGTSADDTAPPAAPRMRKSGTGASMARAAMLRGRSAVALISRPLKRKKRRPKRRRMSCADDVLQVLDKEKRSVGSSLTRTHRALAAMRDRTHTPRARC